jgi:hypothetical protein
MAWEMAFVLMEDFGNPAAERQLRVSPDRLGWNEIGAVLKVFRRTVMVRT